MPYAIAALLAVAAFAGTYFWGRSDGRALERADLQEQHDEAMAGAAVRIAALEKELSGARQRLRGAINAHRPYFECRHSRDGMQHLNQALRGPSGSGELSRTDTAD